MTALSMLDVWQQFAFGYAVALQLVRSQNSWRILQAPEEALRRGAVAAALHHHVQHDAILIHDMPEIACGARQQPTG